MSGETMLPGLTARRLGRAFFQLDEVDSTNSWLWRKHKELPHGAAVSARWQTSGRGTRKRSWDAPPDSCLALSFLLSEAVEPRALALLPLLAGLAVCAGISSLTGFEPGIKWPNDIIAGGKKLGGILCESRLSAEENRAVVGIGVNLAQTEGDFERLDLVYARSLYLVTGKYADANALAAEILNSFEPLWEQYLAEGFGGGLRERYESRCVTLGREILCTSAGAQRRAFARAVAPDGALLVETEYGLEAVYAGDVSVRGLYGYV